MIAVIATTAIATNGKRRPPGSGAEDGSSNAA